VSDVHALAAMRIRIRRVPLTDSIEGIDVRHYAFCEGQIYDVGLRLAELLIVLGYAEPENFEDQATDASRND
jgi:hypothetical protein